MNTYNIIRSQGRNKTIFKSGLDEKTAKTELRHWKRLARNSGGNVYFELTQVPADLEASVHHVSDAA